MAWLYMVNVLRLDPEHLPDLCDDIANLIKQYVIEWILEHYDEYDKQWFVLCRILPYGLLPPRVKDVCAVLAIAERVAPAAAREMLSSSLDDLT